MRYGFLSAATATFALLGAVSAHAQSAKLVDTAPLIPVALQTGDTNPLAQPFSVPTPKKSLQLDSKGRWGLRLDMDKPANRNMDWKDVEAGAYFKLTPRLRVGGSVGLGDKLADAPRIQPSEAAAPRVHLETTFKF